MERDKKEGGGKERKNLMISMLIFSEKRMAYVQCVY
jgi:hypothetical protein